LIYDLLKQYDFKGAMSIFHGNFMEIAAVIEEGWIKRYLG